MSIWILTNVKTEVAQCFMPHLIEKEVNAKYQSALKQQSDLKKGRITKPCACASVRASKL